MNVPKMFRCKLDILHHEVVLLYKLIDVEAMSECWATITNQNMSTLYTN